MSYLTVREYDENEALAASLCPNSILEAFAPLHFSVAGYPMRVKSEKELVRYIDVMHDLSFEEDFANFFSKGLTQEEFELLTQMAVLADKFALSDFNTRAIARPSVLKAINVLQHVNFLYGESRPRILEIGPGCGYLGAFLMRESYPYAGMDVTQAFYLYQNHFWNYVTDGRLLDFVKAANPPEVLTGVSAGTPSHLPWWEFVKLGLKGLPEFDLVICDHAVCEMHWHSLNFLLKTSLACFKRSMGLPKAFIFQGWGSQRISSVGDALTRFYNAGYVLIFMDPLLTVFVPSTATYAIDALKLPNTKGETLPYPYFSLKNPLVQAILKGRALAQEKRRVDLGTINKFYLELAGNSNYFTPDENFLRFVL